MTTTTDTAERTADTRIDQGFDAIDIQQSPTQAISRYLHVERPGMASELAIQSWSTHNAKGVPIRVVAFMPVDLPPYDKEAEAASVKIRKMMLADALEPLNLGRRLDESRNVGIHDWLNRKFDIPRISKVTGKRTGSTKKVKLGTWLRLTRKRDIANMVVYKIRRDWDPADVDALIDGDRLHVRCGICDEWLEDMPRSQVVRHYEAHADATALYCEFCEHAFESADDAAEHVKSGCALTIDYDSDDADVDMDYSDDADESLDGVDVDADAHQEADIGVDADDQPLDAADDAHGAETDEYDEDHGDADAHRVTRCHTCAEVLDITNDAVVLDHALGNCR